MNGVIVHADFDGDCDLVLYDSGGTQRAVFSRDKEVRLATAGSAAVTFFTGTWDLSASTDYRIVVKPTSATSLSIYDFDVAATGLITNLVTAKWYYTHRTDAGAWTDTNTKVPFIGLMLNGFDTGGGSGGSISGGNFFPGGNVNF
jgi:hypothetical protein